MINLLIVEDSAVFAEALVRILHRQIKEDLNVVKVVDTAEKALLAIPDLPVDLVLVDISLPKMSGIELVQTLYQRCPELPCLIVSGDLSSYSVRRSLKAGARGYVIKDRASSIGKAVRRILAGGLYLSTELQASLP
jgi:two-component system response regulator DesR